MRCINLSISFVHCRFPWSGYYYSQFEKFVLYWLMLDLSKLRQLVEKFLKFNALK